MGINALLRSASVAILVSTVVVALGRIAHPAKNFARFDRNLNLQRLECNADALPTQDR